jgi:hypothetical protein
MPLLLMDQAARGTWMNAPIEEAILLQRPAANDAVRVVATGSKEDGASSLAPGRYRCAARTMPFRL